MDIMPQEPENPFDLARRNAEEANEIAYAAGKIGLERAIYSPEPPRGPDLSLHALRYANMLRLPQFKNGKGGWAHTQPDGSDWSYEQWANAITGELGEACNLLKKLTRGDLTLAEAKPLIGRELFDVLAYVDLTAARLGVDLAEYGLLKFNEVTERVGSTVWLTPTAPVICDPDTFDGWFVRVRAVSLQMLGDVFRDEIEEYRSKNTALLAFEQHTTPRDFAWTVSAEITATYF